jgi:hypothetical protein
MKKSFIFLIMLLLSSIMVMAQKDTDLDGISDSQDAYPYDFDNDGMPDVWEKKHGLQYDKNDAKGDPDKDGIQNLKEFQDGTNPLMSELTDERVDRELLSPTETSLIRIMMWGAGGLMVLLIVVFLLFKSHIFNSLKFMHHVSKHMERQNGLPPLVPAQLVPQQNLPPIGSPQPQQPVYQQPQQQYQQPVQQPQQPAQQQYQQTQQAVPNQQTGAPTPVSTLKRLQGNLNENSKSSDLGELNSENKNVFSELSKDTRQVLTH